MRELTERLAGRTTIGVGGPARRVIEVTSEAEALEVLGTLAEPFEVLGGGSNVIIADEGIDVPVLLMASRGIVRRRVAGGVELRAAAGEPWDELVAACVDEGLAGIECLSGIPGRVGATPIQNVGAYGQQIGDCLLGVEVYDRSTRRPTTLSAQQCALGYRDSIFKRAARGRYVVLAVSFALRRGDPAPARYGELAKLLAGSASPDLARVREVVLELRRAKSMVFDPQDPDSRSVGSFFVNPVLGAAEADAVETRARAAGCIAVGEQMPRYPAGAGKAKLAAGWLVERAGFHKGHGAGPAGLSRNHALAIVNRGGASARDIVALAREIRAGVEQRFGVMLHPEPVFLGFAAPPL